ncbi:hypothetical protein TNCV_992501 [Trichonephila clavipes]|nr:hypothetical protein TNCV_992501 [Trichonephila clavipes]
MGKPVVASFWLPVRWPRPTVPNSVYVDLGPEVHEQIFQSGSQSDAKPPVLSSQASLVLIHRQTERMRE